MDHSADPAPFADLLTPLGAHEQTLLIVDDAPANLALLLEVLQPHYRVRAATSGQRALSIANADPQPDLILLDIMMPEMDGYEVLARLRADAGTRHIPVVFVTAVDDAAAEEQGLDLGAADYILKPYRPAVVLARVRMQLELKRARDWLADQNAVLEAEVGRRMAENEAIQDITIHALARLAEMRDPETGQHTRRTQEFVRALALRLRATGRYERELGGRSIDAIVKSAPLHDIGKVAIPDSILLKPGPLTEAEMAVMRTHTTAGCAAIEAAEVDTNRSCDFLRFAKQITQNHHERWDGSGYPHGLRGEMIPLAARLMSLADVFDALTSRRVYKDAFPAERARDMIVAARGTQFDPAVVDAFVDILPELVAIGTSLRDGPDA